MDSISDGRVVSRSREASELDWLPRLSGTFRATTSAAPLGAVVTGSTTTTRATAQTTTTTTTGGWASSLGDGLMLMQIPNYTWWTNYSYVHSVFVDANNVSIATRPPSPCVCSGGLGSVCGSEGDVDGRLVHQRVTCTQFGLELHVDVERG